MRRFYTEFWNTGNVDAADEMISEIVEYFYHEDTFGLFRQLGAFPEDFDSVAGTAVDTPSAQTS